jgi:release factor glutamine methyltransferase
VRSRSSSAPELRGLVLPGVFAPRSDSWLLAAVARREPLPIGARVLELCSGPAFAGVAAAHGRGSLTAVDVSRRAVLNARLNGWLNGVPVTARRGNLFEAVGDERFDLILANPPYVPGPPNPERGPARAWDAGEDGREVVDRICAEAAAHLRPDGTVLLVHSDIIGADTTLEAYTATGLVADVAAHERGPLGPLLRARRAELEARGQLMPGQLDEVVMVLRGRSGRVPSSRSVEACPTP